MMYKKVLIVAVSGGVISFMVHVIFKSLIGFPNYVAWGLAMVACSIWGWNVGSIFKWLERRKKDDQIN